MKYNPSKHHRRSIRLRSHDYTQPGRYFVTICVQHRANLFGHIQNGQMHLNNAGQMFDRWWHKIPEKISPITIDTWVIMPNYVHGIIVIPHPTTNPCSHTNNQYPDEYPMGQFGREPAMDNGRGEHVGSPLPARTGLGRVVQWFKPMATNEYIRGVKREEWPPFHQRSWQRNDDEHISRNEQELERIRNHLANNPAQWMQISYIPKIHQSGRALEVYPEGIANKLAAA